MYLGDRYLSLDLELEILIYYMVLREGSLWL